MESCVGPLSVAAGSKTRARGRKSQHKSARVNYCDVCGLGPAPTRYLNQREVKISMEEFMQSAQNECRACASILRFLISQPLSHTGLTYQLLGSHPVLATGYESLVASYAALDSFTPIDYEFFTVDHTLTGKQQSKFDPGPGHPIIRRLSEPSGDTSSARCFNTMMEWMSRCQKEHALCNLTTGENLPHRIMEIQCLQPLRVRVVEGGSRHGKYACLSYRWGSNSKSTSLNRHNLSLYKAMIPRRKLYPLIRDAITIASKLKLRYIWIDAYCILQDSKEDWEKEAAKMGSIYENAFLTISATDSENGRAIFATKASQSFPVTQVNGEPVYTRRTLRHPCQPRLTEDGEWLYGATLRRAWIYQERLLSRRFVHFTRDELFWECRESTWCECGSASEAWAQQRGRKPRMLRNQTWELIADQYDCTELTYEDDRLPALAGVASRFAEIHGKTYLAGHWAEDLPSSLAWVKGSGAQPRPLHQTTPTWSWASLPQGNGVQFSAPRPPDMRLLGYSRKSPGADIYAGAEQTELTVEGHVLDMKIYKEKPRLHCGVSELLGQAGQAFLTMRPDFDVDPEDPTKYQAVPDGTSCSLLLLNRPGESHSTFLVGILLLQRISTDSKIVTFERIGYLRGYDLRTASHLDESGELKDYCGGGLAPVKKGAGSRVPLTWLWERAEKRQITLV